MSLKLDRLPRRTPVKLTSPFPPEIHEALLEYAALYEQTYGEKESVENLVPYMIAAFLEKDSAFKKARKALAPPSQQPAKSPPIKTDKGV